MKKELPLGESTVVRRGRPGMNPFNTDRDEVTRTTLAPSNPPKKYASGSGDMLKKLLSISENTRRQLSRQVTVGSGQAEENAQKRRAVTVPLLSGPQRRTERRMDENGVVVTVDRGVAVDAVVRNQAPCQAEEEVIDLVSDEDEPSPSDRLGDRTVIDKLPDACRKDEQCRSTKAHTGVALFDVFDEDDYCSEDEAHPNHEYVEDFEYGEGCGPEFRGQDLYDDVVDAEDPLAAPYGLPPQVKGDDWWQLLPDFQPISSILRAGNRDTRGNTVFVDFLGQFKGTRVPSPAGTSAGGRRSSTAAMAGGSGHWETRDGQRTFISATGRALTGVQAYREYTKSGAKRKTSKTSKTSKKKSRRKKRGV